MAPLANVCDLMYIVYVDEDELNALTSITLSEIENNNLALERICDDR